MKRIALPKLNGLTPSLESTALKLMEEAGELAREIGKHRRLNGENITVDSGTVLSNIGAELLDVAQTAVSMMFILEEQYGVNIGECMMKHNEKLIRKGYIK